MKTLIPLIVYALLSGLIGLLICTWLLWKSKRPIAAAIAAFIFFGGPPALYGYLYFKEKSAQTSYQEDLAYLKELCAAHGGDKIYKTIDDVQGVFQMKARNPDGDFQWADQYGMIEPWALASGDWSRTAVTLGTRKGQGYWFIEQQPEFGKPEGPPYRRAFLTVTKNKADIKDSQAIVSADGFWLKKQEMTVLKLRSRYGYTTEDLTTPELRRRWIGGGKVKIVDLQTNEVLAERTDFYRATGPQVKMAWASGTGCPSGPPRLVEASLRGFIMEVLRPPRTLPTEQQLLQIQGE